jgi:O-antigen ligase
MTKAALNSDLAKSKGQVIFEYILLVICLSVIALRITFTESPSAQSTTLPANLSDSVYSLTVSAVLIFAFVFWLVWNLCSKKLLYRPTGIEIGLCLFCAAAIASGLAAANKRAAITDFATLLAPPLCALLLVQILDSQSKVKLLLALIAALGVLSAYQCADQFFFTNRMMIEQYEQAPQTFTDPLGIEPDTFQQFLFEHRLYSRGVRGFFTTRNSAGSFALIAFFTVVALLVDKLKNRKSDSSWLMHVFTCSIAAVFILFGLALTRSKGAIVGLFSSAAVFIAYLRFANWLKAHKKAILIVCFLLVVAAGSIIIRYGLNHGRLPGGSPMLVRWQYWHASAKMYADRPFTGVGPGNFAHFYTHYKPAEALETVANPHNFLLSILTQYGPLGLIGFLAMIFLPLWRAISPNPVSSLPKTHLPQPTFRARPVIFLLILWLALLLARLIVTPAVADGIAVIIYMIVRFYVGPVAVFIIGFWLLTKPLHTIRNTQHAIRNTNITTAALFCVVLGVILHNLIDFAIFEPGVFTTFWAIIACVIVLDFNAKCRPKLVLKSAPFVKVITAAAALVLVGAYFNYALIPVAKSTAGIQRAHHAISAGQFQQAHNLLNTAAKNDSLSPTASSLNGRVYLRHFELTQSRNRDLLVGAEASLLEAISRDKADFKNFEKLIAVYDNFAKITPQKKDHWLEKAYNSAEEAVKRYPGSGRLRNKLAKIAEELGKTDVATKHYEEAVNIEDKYRRQFEIMYPEEEEIFSRLGEEEYKNAKQRIKHLSQQPTP